MQPAAQYLKCAWLGPESPGNTSGHLSDNDCPGFGKAGSAKQGRWLHTAGTTLTGGSGSILPQNQGSKNRGQESNICKVYILNI